MFVLYGGVDDAEIESQLRGQVMLSACGSNRRLVGSAVGPYVCRPAGVIRPGRQFSLLASALESGQTGDFCCAVLDLRRAELALASNDWTQGLASLYEVMGRFQVPLALLAAPGQVRGLVPVVNWMSAQGSLCGLFSGATCDSRALEWSRAMAAARLP